MVEQDIIEEVVGLSEWCICTVVVFKQDKSIRIFANLLKLNEVVICHSMQMSTLNELNLKLNGVSVFSLLNCQNSYSYSRDNKYHSQK